MPRRISHQRKNAVDLGRLVIARQTPQEHLYINVLRPPTKHRRCGAVDLTPGRYGSKDAFLSADSSMLFDSGAFQHNSRPTVFTPSHRSSVSDVSATFVASSDGKPFHFEAKKPITLTANSRRHKSAELPSTRNSLIQLFRRLSLSERQEPITQPALPSLPEPLEQVESAATFPEPFNYIPRSSEATPLQSLHSSSTSSSLYSKLSGFIRNKKSDSSSISSSHRTLSSSHSSASSDANGAPQAMMPPQNLPMILPNPDVPAISLHTPNLNDGWDWDPSPEGVAFIQAHNAMNGHPINGYH